MASDPTQILQGSPLMEHLAYRHRQGLGSGQNWGTRVWSWIENEGWQQMKQELGILQLPGSHILDIFLSKIGVQGETVCGQKPLEASF